MDSMTSSLDSLKRTKPVLYDEELGHKLFRPVCWVPLYQHVHYLLPQAGGKEASKEQEKEEDFLYHDSSPRFPDVQHPGGQLLKQILRKISSFAKLLSCVLIADLR